MKKFALLVFVSISCPLISFSQGEFQQDTLNVDSIYIEKSIDEMTGEIKYAPNRLLVVTDETKSKGFGVGCWVDKKFSFYGMYTKSFNIGNCHENDEIIILFENGMKITKKSWKGFNCEGVGYFNMNDMEQDLLSKVPVSKIRITNGRSRDSYTADIPNKDKRYFIQLFYAINNRLATEKNSQ